MFDFCKPDTPHKPPLGRDKNNNNPNHYVRHHYTHTIYHSQKDTLIVLIFEKTFPPNQHGGNVFLYLQHEQPLHNYFYHLRCAIFL